MLSDLIRNLFQPRDYVVLRILNDGWKKVRAEWIDGELFAAPYRAKTRTRLLRGGNTDGACYVKEWRPVTPATSKRYYGGEVMTDLEDCKRLVWNNSAPKRYVPRSIDGAPRWRAYDRKEGRYLSSDELVDVGPLSIVSENWVT